MENLLWKIVAFFKRICKRERKVIPRTDAKWLQRIKEKLSWFYLPLEEEPEELPEEPPAEPGPTFLEKLLMCFVRKKPDPLPEEPLPYIDHLAQPITQQVEEPEEPVLITDHLAMLMGGPLPEIEVKVEEPIVEVKVEEPKFEEPEEVKKTVKPKKKKVKTKKKKMKLVYVPEEETARKDVYIGPEQIGDVNEMLGLKPRQNDDIQNAQDNRPKYELPGDDFINPKIGGDTPHFGLDQQPRTEQESPSYVNLFESQEDRQPTLEEQEEAQEAREKWEGDISKNAKLGPGEALSNLLKLQADDNEGNEGGERSDSFGGGREESMSVLRDEESFNPLKSFNDTQSFYK